MVTIKLSSEKWSSISKSSLVEKVTILLEFSGLATLYKPTYTTYFLRNKALPSRITVEKIIRNFTHNTKCQKMVNLSVSMNEQHKLQVQENIHWYYS